MSTRDDLGRVFETGGALGRALAAGSFEERTGQRDMALAVFDAMQDGKHLVVEAGTGTGKTLAYLLAAALSGRKTVVSTATRALQDQILLSDVPRLVAALAELGRSVTVASMKGLTNYVCRRRYEEAIGGSIEGSLERIVEWMAETGSGDVSELSDVSDTSEAWLKVRSSSDTRLGSSCKFYESCFVTEMKRGAERADIIVVNHHLFFADLALRSRTEGGYASVIPPYDAIIFDEAHQIENVASEFFGSRVTSARFDAIANDAKRAFMREGLESEMAGASELLDALVDTSKRWFESLPRGEVGDRTVLGPSQVTRAFRESVMAVDDRLGDLFERMRAYEARDAFRALTRRIETLRSDLADLLTVEDAAEAEEAEEPGPNDRVYWVDRRERSLAVGSTAVDLAGIFRERLFERVPSVVCTSATLSAGGSFHYLRSRLGTPEDATELAIPSPFDYASRAGLYIAGDLPDPKSPAYEQASHARIIELLETSEGGAFVLTTSVRSMRKIADTLRARTAHPVLLQGESSKTVLLDRFRKDPRAVLVATMTFWEGVDVPGDALRLVVLDKLPFPVPTDPLVMARSSRLDRAGGSSFVEYMIPQAAITLKQGFGRLIRGKGDRGVVAILDSRAVAKGYGKRLLRGLPPARRLETIEDVRRFWNEVMRSPRE